MKPIAYSALLAVIGMLAIPHAAAADVYINYGDDYYRHNDRNFYKKYRKNKLKNHVRKRIRHRLRSEADDYYRRARDTHVNHYYYGANYRPYNRYDRPVVRVKDRLYPRARDRVNYYRPNRRCDRRY